MNWIARTLAGMFLGATTSVLTVAVLLFLEARNGQALFSYAALTYIPLGAIAVGMVGSLGYFAGFLAVRVRPVFALLLVMAGISGGVVFLAQSAEFGLFMGAPGATKNVVSFSRFLVKSVAHPRLRFWSVSAGEGGYASSSGFVPGASASAMPQVPGGDAKVDGIGAGVQGMMATEDVSKTAAGQQMTAMDQRLQMLGAKVHSNSSEWALVILQTVGFALGSGVVFFYVRTLPHCTNCMLLLRKKGARTRYYSRTKDMRSSVDDVLTRARDKQLQQSIHAHIAKGAESGGNWSEYCSTMEIRRCMQCRTHRVSFRTRRKTGETWKDIDLLGFTAFSYDPLDFA